LIFSDEFSMIKEKKISSTHHTARGRKGTAESVMGIIWE
jgi:hypothetical protein